MFRFGLKLTTSLHMFYKLVDQSLLRNSKFCLNLSGIPDLSTCSGPQKKFCDQKRLQYAVRTQSAEIF